ncbi:hypothetical protein FRB90_005494 [Tulasnella sp. 427]|nr:hypothetical protein FRB90_005494 [Tulasnella sp. 427]
MVYYNGEYYATPGVSPSGYLGVPTVIRGQTFYFQAYYLQPSGYGPPPALNESYRAYAMQEIARDPSHQQQQQQQQPMQQAQGASQRYPPIQAAYYQSLPMVLCLLDPHQTR